MQVVSVSRRRSSCRWCLANADMHLPPVNTTALQAAKSRDQEGSGSQHFSEVMAGFHAGAAEEFRELEASFVGLFHWVCLEGRV